jgi:hypothetical protein
MTAPRIGNAHSIIAPRRPRQTARDNTFRRVLAGGTQVLLSGAQIATGLVGLPTLSAAISRARLGSAVSGPAKGSAGAAGAAGAGAAGDAQSPDQLMKQLQDQRMQDELKLLALQSNIQQQNRQVSLVSNVMKARHDTAKAAISNIRS